MRDNLPLVPRGNELLVCNLGDSSTGGTHWVSFRKFGFNVKYFDSFGNLPPPIEIVNYLRHCNIKYNKDRFQTFNTFHCGHLVVLFLLGHLKIKNYVDYTGS